MEEDKKFCKHCGEKIDKDSVVCPKCGRQLKLINNEKATDSENMDNNKNKGGSSTQGDRGQIEAILWLLRKPNLIWITPSAKLRDGAEKSKEALRWNQIYKPEVVEKAPHPSSPVRQIDNIYHTDCVHENTQANGAGP